MVSVTLIILGFVGLLLSFYALHVKKKAQKDKWYKPFCEIGEHVSCLKAFCSEHSELSGMPNMIWGIVFYVYVIILAFFDLSLFIRPFAFIAVLFCCYLAYLSYYKQRNFCVVCNAVYLVNLLILIFSLLF